jgi:hypothetical protein
MPVYECGRGLAPDGHKYLHNFSRITRSCRALARLRMPIHIKASPRSSCRAQARLRQARYRLKLESRPTQPRRGSAAATNANPIKASPRSSCRAQARLRQARYRLKLESRPTQPRRDSAAATGFYAVLDKTVSTQGARLKMCRYLCPDGGGSVMNVSTDTPLSGASPLPQGTGVGL